MINRQFYENLIDKYLSSTSRLVVKIPFYEFDDYGLDSKVYSWYAATLQTYPNIKSAVPIYFAKAIYVIKMEKSTMCEWVLEIPYGKREKYYSLMFSVNNIVSIGGTVGLFVSNNPYDLHSYLCIKDREENKESIQSLFLSYPELKAIHDKGITEFIREMQFRKYDSRAFLCGMSYDEVCNTAENMYAFPSEAALEELGYKPYKKIERKKVFISYSHKNSCIVNDVLALLETYGANVWIDKKCIDYGDNIVASITSALNESDLAVLFASEDVLSSSFVLFEFDNIFSQYVGGKIQWFVVKLDDVDVNDINPMLGHYLYYDYSANKHNDDLAKAIIEKIKKL